MATLDEVKRQIRQALGAAGIEEKEARRESDLIIEHATGFSLVDQILRAGEPLAASIEQAIEAIVYQRRQRIPLQYCLGYAHFMGLKLAVKPGVFIPRMDTEALVAVVVQHLASLKAAQIVEIGPGSGAIAISILKRVPGSYLTAIDISQAAVELTRENAAAHGVLARLKLVRADWTVALAGRFDAIVANPPYIPSALGSELQPEVSLYEPREALIGSEADGLGMYRLLAASAPAHLNPGGFVAVEIGDGQDKEVMNIFAGSGFRKVEIYRDTNNLPRVVVAASATGGF